MPTAKTTLAAGLTAAILLMFWPIESDATTVERLTLEGLTAKARSIIIGKVQGSRTYWSNDRKLILTTHTIVVEEVIKGQSGKTVEVTTIGGQMGDVILHVAGMPVFQAGESTVVFVEQSASFSTVVGLGQGKFTIADGEVANAVSGLAFPDGGRAAPLKMPLGSFKNHIRSIINRRP